MRCYVKRSLARGISGVYSSTNLAGHQRLYSTPPTKQGPLTGIRILDLTRVLAGPFCTQILADYGAEVIKVEHPKGGDDTRLWREPGEDRLWKPNATNTSLYFNTINRNKKSIAVDLKHPHGREIILELAKCSDVMYALPPISAHQADRNSVDNFIPGKLEQLRLGYSTLRQTNPSIIHASVSGYGATGPYALRAGYDVIAAAEGGLLHITGEPDGPPTKPGVGLMDLCTGLYLHGAICAALVARQKTGRGQKLDASLFETTLALMSNVAMSWLNLGREAQRWGTGHPTIVPYGVFKTKDSSLVLGAVNNRQFKVMCERLGKKELAEDERFVDNGLRVKHRVELKQILDECFAGKTTNKWLGVFEGSGMPYGPVNTLQKAFEHPQTAARHMVQTIDHEATAEGTMKVIGNPVKFSETQPSIRSSPPALGQDTDEVLQKMGWSMEKIAQLRQEGVL
ncbi:CaiB/BaiF CoA transferase family protein [Aspergillus thermomutatus]|uniref:Uncharacterized protein n=1 Tax=Aspergillus thermomutatus TaxID=41047 RepID=A0A397GDL9_ASPTH|nr:uncharacterized protein CDV56_105251 [Aspergillus thermomutatus]RHZ47728.1 hypothetical protein CDV56_105251 [Aspergillus thermomutatus]